MPISICVIRIMPTIIIVILSNAFVFETIFRHEIPITNSQLYPFKFLLFSSLSISSFDFYDVCSVRVFGRVTYTSFRSIRNVSSQV